MPDACIRCCIATKREDGILEERDATFWILVDTVNPFSVGDQLQELPAASEEEETKHVLPTDGQSGTLDIPLPEFSLNKLESEEMVEMHMTTFPANSDSVHLLHMLQVRELEIQMLEVSGSGVQQTGLRIACPKY